MSAVRIAPRYAKSLLDLSIEENKLAEVVSDIEQFKTALDSKELMNFFKSPIIKSNKKVAAYNAAFDGKFNPLVDNFIRLVITKGREQYMPEIVTEFLNQYNIHKGVSGIKLVSAKPLSDDMIAEIKSKLKNSSETKSDVDIEFEVDEKLIGGFKIEIGDKLYDASVAHKLERLRKEFI